MTLRDSDFNGSKVKTVKIDLIDIPSYQRNEMSGWARFLAENWDHHLFTFPRVSAKEDGRFDAIDGQHTILAAALRGHAELPCAVLEDVDHVKAAAIFSDINTNRKRLVQYDVFRADLEAGRPWAVTLDDIATRHGLRVSRSGGPLSLQAIGQARAILNEGGERDLDDALYVLTSAFDAGLPESASRVERKIVVGMVDLIRRARRAEMFDREAFVKRLGRATYRRRGVSGIHLTPESIERDYIPAKIESGELEMPPLNTAAGAAKFYGKALALAIFGSERAKALY